MGEPEKRDANTQYSKCSQGMWGKRSNTPNGLWGKRAATPDGLWGDAADKVEEAASVIADSTTAKHDEDSKNPPGLWGREVEGNDLLEQESRMVPDPAMLWMRHF